MLLPSLTILLAVALSVHGDDSIPIKPLTKVVDHKGYFSDPYHVPYQNSQGIYISGTTHAYLECDQSLTPECASAHKRPPNNYENDDHLNQTAKNAGVNICGAAGIHPYQSGSGPNRKWDAVVTLHVRKEPCDGIKGWSIIVHASPKNASEIDTPPKSWIGDTVLIGDFKKNVRANYDGKYFTTPAGQLYLVYQKQHSHSPRRDGVVAWPMADFKTLAGSEPTPLLLPNEGSKSEDYVHGDGKFKLIETGNIVLVNGKFVMAYSAGAYDHTSYKIGIAYSDTFLPGDGQQYRKVMKDNPDGLWNSTGKQEVYYLLQADEPHPDWHYVGDQVKAPGVPTVAPIGEGGSWILLFAGYDPQDDPTKHHNKYVASHRRPYFLHLNVSVPAGPTVKGASDADLQSWITPMHD